MALIHSISSKPAYNPQSEIVRLFNSLFDSPTPLSASFATPRRSFTPAIDVAEREDELILSADLPGLRERDVKLEILGDVLTISGARELARENETGDYRLIERSSGGFVRRLRLPRGVDPTAVNASFTNGVLEVHVPKPDAAKPQAIAITPAS